MGTCTVIARGKHSDQDRLECFMPLRDALDLADSLWKHALYAFIRVYSESASGDLTLIYSALNHQSLCAANVWLYRAILREECEMRQITIISADPDGGMMSLWRNIAIHIGLSGAMDLCGSGKLTEISARLYSSSRAGMRDIGLDGTTHEDPADCVVYNECDPVSRRVTHSYYIVRRAGEYRAAVVRFTPHTSSEEITDQ